MKSKKYRSERLRVATINYLTEFAKSYEVYGHTDMWPHIVERSITDDMQLLEILEAARKEWLAAFNE